MAYEVIYKGLGEVEHRIVVDTDSEINAVEIAFKDCPADIRRRIHGVHCEPCEGEDRVFAYTGNMPCDNYGLCAGTSCPMYFKCHG